MGAALGIRRPALRTRTGGTVTGLEIGATGAVAAQARIGDDGAIAVERLAAQPLPAGLLHEGAVVDPDGLGRELKRLFRQHRLPRRVRVGLATPRTILRVVDLPPMDERDLGAALRMQAHEHIPMPLDRAVVDFQPLGVVDTPEGRRARTVVVATDREAVERLLLALRRAGLKPVGVDLSIFALIRSLRVRGGAHDEPVVYAQLGDLGNVAVAEAGVCRFTRLATTGLETIAEQVADDRELTREQALALVLRVGADGPLDPADPDEQAARELLRRALADLGAELRGAAEFHASQFGSLPATRGVVAGALAAAPGVVEALAAASGLQLAAGEVPLLRPGALGGADPQLAPVAAGLAVAEVPA